MTHLKCKICNRLRLYLMELTRNGEFKFSPGPRTIDDLYTKYKTGNSELWNFKVYIDQIMLCPDCKGSDVGTKNDVKNHSWHHYHICVKCGWKSDMVKGDAFETLEEKKSVLDDVEEGVEV